MTARSAPTSRWHAGSRRPWYSCCAPQCPGSTRPPCIPDPRQHRSHHRGRLMATKLKTGNFSADQLNQLVARIERLEEEKKALADDIKEVYAEGKAHGFDIKILRQEIGRAHV